MRKTDYSTRGEDYTSISIKKYGGKLAKEIEQSKVCIIHGEQATNETDGNNKQNQMTAEQFGEEIAPELKKRGFRKHKLYWYKKNDDLTVLFSIQKSMWGKELWYYNYGVSINSLHNVFGYSLQYYDISTRFDQVFRKDDPDDCLRQKVNTIFKNRGTFVLSAEDVISVLDLWIDEYGSIDQLKRKTQEGALPFWTLIKAKSYLTDE